MKKIFLIVLLLVSYAFGKDEKNLIYVIEVFQEEMSNEKIESINNSDIRIHLGNLDKNYFSRVGIIKLGKKNKIIESHVKKESNADINGEIYTTFNELVNINFLECKFNYPVNEKGELIKGIPMLIKQLETKVDKDNTKLYRGLALIDKETYEEKPTYLKYPGILKMEIEKKMYICSN